MSKKEFLITVIIVLLAIALIATIIVLKKLDAANPDETTGTTSGVAHDHDGDGVPDHGDDAHADEDSQDNTTSATGGSNEDAVIPEDSDIDISVDLEDLPTNGDSATEGGSTDTTEGGSTDTTEGGFSGAVSGDEIDFDDLNNAGKK